MAADPSHTLRSASRRSYRIAVSLIVLLVAGASASFAWAWFRPPMDQEEWLALQLIFWAPTLFYVAGLMATAQLFRAIAQGDLFNATVAGGLRRTGTLMLIGGGVSALATLVLQTSELPRGFMDGTTRPFSGMLFDSAHFVLIFLGYLLRLLARLIVIAGDLRDENRRMSAELDEIP